MKESNNISDLFAKAANEPVHTSFDETKKLFLATLPVNSSASGSKAGLLTKKWIIMLSIFTTGVLITALYLSSPKGEPQKSQTTRDSIAQTEQQSNKTATIAERDTKKTSSNRRVQNSLADTLHLNHLKFCGIHPYCP